MTAEGAALFEYVYEFRRGDEILATGRLGRPNHFDVEDRITIAGQSGLVTRIERVSVSPAPPDHRGDSELGRSRRG